MNQIINQSLTENQMDEKIKKTTSVFAIVIQIGLFLVFATLKFIGVIDWGWFWVCVPIFPLLWQGVVLVSFTLTSVVLLSIVKIVMKLFKCKS